MQIRKILTLLLLNLFCSTVTASEQLYKIELIIFLQDMPNTEVFDQIETQIAWPKKVVKRSTFEKVSREDMSLLGSFANISVSQTYQPLMHVAWLQSVESNKLGTAVQISNRGGTINGFFRIQRGNLVYMIADIEYSSDSIIYRLNEKRRFKYNETHYLDHPKFGILARISPIEVEVETETETATE